MKVISFLMLLSINLISYAQDTINWKREYKLKWEDFCATPDTLSEYGALSYCGIRYSLIYNQEKCVYTIVSFFNKGKSWVRIRSTYGLVHEQTHFDISELFARKLKKKFSEYIFNPNTISQDFKKIFEQTELEREKMNLLYDETTDFSRNTKQQLYWNKKIAQELKKSNQVK